MNSSHLSSMAMMSASSIPQLFHARFSMTGSSGPPSEAQSSEISSVESDFSDLKSIAAGLGIVDPEEVYTERFKIDRLKLEDMIKSKLKDYSSFCICFHQSFLFPQPKRIAKE